MRIAHKDFKFNLELKENSRIILVVESPRVFREMISELENFTDSDEAKFVFSENNNIIKIQEFIQCIINPLKISLNTKKTISRLYEIIKSEVTSTDLLIKNNKICSLLEQFILSVLSETDFELTYNDKIELQDMLKLFDVKFNDIYIDLLEKIIEYLRINYSLLNTKCFVFVNILSYLQSYEVDKLYEFAEYNKIKILLIESRQPEIIERYSQMVIIDKAGCEICLDM